MSPLQGALAETAWSVRGDPIGFVHVGDVTPASCQYVSGYTVKKMTVKHDHRLRAWRRDGVELHPEFARMSNRPGIGAPAMSVLCEKLLTDAGLDDFMATGDVPMAIRFGGSKKPLGRYLRRKLREEMGVSAEDAKAIKERFYSEKTAEMRELLRASSLAGTSRSMRDVLTDSTKQQAASMEALARIHDSKGKVL
jgi:hypothetical protein